MGNYRFRLSDIMPNAWFYKLKDMGKTSRSSTSTTLSLKKTHAAAPPKAPHPPPIIPRRASYYIHRTEDKLPSSPVNLKASDTKFLADPSRRSRKKPRAPKSSTTKLLTSSVSAGCSCRATFGSVIWKPESPLPEYPPSVPETCRTSNANDYDEVDDKPVISENIRSRHCSCKIISSATDIIIDLEDDSSSKKKTTTTTTTFIEEVELDLPPILTKPVSKKDPDSCAKKTEQSPRRRSFGGGQGSGVRVRKTNSPKVQVGSTRCRKQRGLSGSFAVVKSSSDPQSDFRDSMVEMIVENDIRAAKDLEELLACYLSLNSNEYHDVIVKVFEQIWFDIVNIRFQRKQR